MRECDNRWGWKGPRANVVIWKREKLLASASNQTIIGLSSST